MKQINIQTPGGTADCNLFLPEGEKKSPVIIFYMDAFGIRPALNNMAQRLADNGFAVLLPNFYYRFGDFAPFDVATTFQNLPERERIMGMIKSLKIQTVMQDTSMFLDWLSQEQAVDTTKTGTLGYCMGGKFALSAAAFFPENILASASVHGGNLVTDQPDSFHLLSDRIKGKIYVGIASNDSSFTDEHWKILQAAFDAAGVNATLELYPGASHGFAVNDHTFYNYQAAEKLWKRIVNLFYKTLK